MKLVKAIMQINAYFKNKHYLLSDPDLDSDLSYSDLNLDLDLIRFLIRIQIFKNIRPIRSVQNTNSNRQPGNSLAKVFNVICMVAFG